MSSNVETEKDSFGTYYQLYKRDSIPIVFIHGVGLHHGIWKDQIYSFDNTVLTYDILGHGKTPLEKNIITLLKSHKQSCQRLWILKQHQIIFIFLWAILVIIYLRMAKAMAQNKLELTTVS